MKKMLVLVLLVISAVTASAQMMTSRTLMKRESPTLWYVRAGFALNSLTGMDSDDKEYLGTAIKAGFELDFGFNKPIGKSGTYWGMELGIGNRGGKITQKDTDNATSYNTWSLNYSPITFGYKYSVTDDIKLDIHLGAYALVDLSRKAKNNDGHECDADLEFTNRYDAGIQVGLGAWYKRFNLDFMYRHGFVGFVSMPYNNLNSSAFLIRLGYAF